MFGKVASFFVGGNLAFIIYAIIGTFILTSAIGLRMYVRGLEKDVSTSQETISQLTAANEILKHNNEVLTENVNALTEANKANLSTIKKLQEERQDAINSVKNLANANARDRQALTRLASRVQEMLKDPKTDGELAPVLREVIREIQIERSKL